MEDTLRVLMTTIREQLSKAVLILVLMEDTLRAISTLSFSNKLSVLILVLMEDTLRGSHRSFRYHYQTFSLNPCFNGRYSQRAKTYVPLYTSIWGMFKLLEMLLLT